MQEECKVRKMWSVLEENVHRSIHNNILGVAFIIEIAKIVVSHFADFKDVFIMNVFAHYAATKLHHHHLNSANMLETMLCTFLGYTQKYYLTF